ncbi:PDR/VanB family oxidoreductase [Amycolatopsis carbonis]|uniref:PDR/VanB family oxidoreductase n=1 Tax=Amycolatopsis carbonis TaxID=715471 RepID=A0A9Y2INE9_9PSEU|nr:PDR/VanB family oxidoreductase [Amycolatopsis sp. 2-15]WIX82221.1 PDR/VanB family oxidoreductase [Amycolatopsis sp. 2-15]
MTDVEVLEVAAIRERAEGVRELTLARPDGGRLPDWTPGSHIDLVLPNGLTRQYSLCGDRWDSRTYRVAVLREPDGRGGSAYVHDVVGVGDRLGVGWPRNNFPLVPATEYLFIAGGIGITPVLPMIHQAELLGIEWHLLYGGRRRASMAFLDELATYGDRVHAVPQDERGLLDLAAWLGEAKSAARVYCCGPAPLLDAVEAACAHWPAHALHTERFVAAERTPARDEAFEVELRRSGKTIRVTPEISVLEAIRNAGVDVLSSCEHGTCGTCETVGLDGLPDHRDSLLAEHDRETADCMYVCVSRSRTDRLALDL